MQDRRTAELERQLQRDPADLTAWVELARQVRHTRELPESMRDGRHVGALFRAWELVPEERLLDLLTLDYLGLRALPGSPPPRWTPEAAAEDREGWYDRATGAPLRVRFEPLRLEFAWLPAGHYMTTAPVTEAAWGATMGGLADAPLDAPLAPPHAPPRDDPWSGTIEPAVNFLRRLTRRWAGQGPLPAGWRLRLPTAEERRAASAPEGILAAGDLDEWVLDPAQDGPRGDHMLGLAPDYPVHQYSRRALGGGRRGGFRVLLEPPPGARLEDLDLRAAPGPSWTRRVTPWNPGGEVVETGTATVTATGEPVRSRKGRWVASLSAEPIAGKEGQVLYRVHLRRGEDGEPATTHEWRHHGQGPRPGGLRFARDETRLFLVASGTKDHYLATFELGP